MKEIEAVIILPDGTRKKIVVPLVPRIKSETDELTLKGHVCAVIERADGTKQVLETHNLITTAGDVFVVQKAAGEAPTDAFDSLHLGTGTPTPAKSSDSDDLTHISGSGKVVSGGYPKTDDDDADNTGAGADVISWKFEYATSDGPWSGVNEGALIEGAANPAAASPIFNLFAFGSSFDKNAGERLTVFLNVDATGA